MGTALLILWARAPGPPPTAVDRGPARADVIPSTVPPLTTPATAQPDTTPPPVPATIESPDGRADGPGLADVLPPIDRGAALPDAIDPRAAPIGIENTVFDSTLFPVRPIGLEDDGELEIPDETEIGWYRYGATAGAPGTTVLAAHVSWNGTTGPFFELGRIDPGARVSVTLDDGTAREYEVIERARYEKDELPRDRIWRTTGPETLVLITCGGDFNPDIRRYRDNIVVYAVPVG